MKRSSFVPGELVFSSYGYASPGIFSSITDICTVSTPCHILECVTDSSPMLVIATKALSSFYEFRDAPTWCYVEYRGTFGWINCEWLMKLC